MSDRILETLQRIQNIQRLLQTAEALSRADSPPKPTTPPRPQGLHKLTYALLLRLREYLHEALALNPKRHISPLQRKRADTQFVIAWAGLNVDLPVAPRLAGQAVVSHWRSRPDSSRIAEDADSLGRAGRITCSIERRERSHRYFSRDELVRILRTRR